MTTATEAKESVGRSEFKEWIGTDRLGLELLMKWELKPRKEGKLGKPGWKRENAGQAEGGEEGATREPALGHFGGFFFFGVEGVEGRVDAGRGIGESIWEGGRSGVRAFATELMSSIRTQASVWCMRV